MNSETSGNTLSAQEHVKLYPPIDLKRPFFPDLRCGNIFSFCCEGGFSARKLVKVSHDSYISLTADIHGLNADPEKDIFRVSSEQQNSPVYVYGTMLPADYMVLYRRYTKLMVEKRPQ